MLKIQNSGRSSGLLPVRSAFPSAGWRTVARLPCSLIEITAAGTAPDFHRVPLTVSATKVNKIIIEGVFFIELNKPKKVIRLFAFQSDD